MSGTAQKRSAPVEQHLAAIYVHAGAGYHSVQNENIHLQACADAAKMAMAALRTGSSAMDAVEMAISSLENNDVTNAGYGSNLTVEGKVEGDATIVDHYGRSGAVGAIGRVANPIHVARMVYERSIRPMALRRVPPNLLVGDGAVDFAHENGISIMPNESLVAPGSIDRYVRWRADIDAAKRKYDPTVPDSERSPSATSEFVTHLTEEEQRTVRDFGPAGSHNPTIAALANESQPFSPAESQDNLSPMFPTTAPSTSSGPNKLRRRSISRASAANGHVDSILDVPGFDSHGPDPPTVSIDPQGNLSLDDADAPSAQHFWNVLRDSLVAESSETALSAHNNASMPDLSRSPFASHTSTASNAVGAHAAVANDQMMITVGDGGQDEVRSISGDTVGAIAQHMTIASSSSANLQNSAEDGDDMISDTVGAIAVDKQGNIAAASSSGGIGMKHRGRVGPAALVGIGTAVVPISDDDTERTTVACVTSGTGEHMATSLAAGTCAQRLYSNSRVDGRGILIPCDDEEAMQSFIKRDFMGHPSVKHSTTGGAIGLMAVKKDNDGMWLYFAHNTDSFALASMHGDDTEPNTVMSRLSKQGKITTGGRAMRPTPVNVSSPLTRPKAKRSKQSRQTIGNGDAFG